MSERRKLRNLFCEVAFHFTKLSWVVCFSLQGRFFMIVAQLPVVLHLQLIPQGHVVFLQIMLRNPSSRTVRRPVFLRMYERTGVALTASVLFFDVPASGRVPIRASPVPQTAFPYLETSLHFWKHVSQSCESVDLVLAQWSFHHWNDPYGASGQICQGCDSPTAIITSSRTANCGVSFTHTTNDEATGTCRD